MNSLSMESEKMNSNLTRNGALGAVRVMGSSRLLGLFWIVVILFVLSGRNIEASIYYWTNSSGLWSGNNWSTNPVSGGTGTTPGASATNSVVFNQSSVNGAESITINGTTTIGGMTFNNTGLTTLQSSSATTRTLNLGSNGITVNSGAGSVTLGNTSSNIAVALTAAQTWSNSSTNTLTIKSGISGAFGLTFAGSGNTIVNGVIATAAGTLTNAGTGTTTLTAANTYTGGTVLKAGTLAISNNAAMGTGIVTFASNSTISSLANLKVTNAFSIASNATAVFDVASNTVLTNSGAITGLGGLNKIDSGTLALTATNNYSGLTILDGGTTAFTGALTNTNSIEVGNSNSSVSMIISNGSKVNVTTEYVGYNTGSSNDALLVTGTNSSLLLTNTGGSLSVGYYGNGSSLVISNGGAVTSLTTSIGVGTGYSSNNAVLVTGTNSSLNTTGIFYLGYYGNSNSLVISNGGAVTAYYSEIGFGGSDNAALVTGTNSTWSNTGILVIGAYASTNSLIISNGGAVISPVSTIIGDGIGISNNSVLVTGSGSILSNTASGVLTIGNAGSGALTVANGGIIEAGTILIANSNSAIGTLNIGSYGGSDAAGTIISTNLVFGSGSGSINFNQTNSFQFTNSISGVGNLNQLGSGTTSLTATNTYTGSTTVNRGGLNLGTTGRINGTTNVVIGSGGTLLLGASNQINTNAALTLNGGILSLEAGTTRAPTTILNSLTLTANSTIDFSSLSGNSVLQFGTIALGANTLDILNWNGTTQWGTVVGTNATQLIDLASNSLTLGQLANISFYSGSTIGPSDFLGTGVFSGNLIIPVPEPAVILTSVLLLAGLIIRRGMKTTTANEIV